MHPSQVEVLVTRDWGRNLTATAARRAEVDRALQEGGRLRPTWLGRFATWWTDAVAAFRPCPAVDPMPPQPPAPRGCFN